MLNYLEGLSISDEVWQRVLPAAISGLVVTLLFVVGRFLDSKIRSKEIRRTWYLNVIINPNILKLESFYNDTAKQLDQSIQHLCNLQTSAFDTYVAQQTIEIGKFQKLKRKFEIGFIALIQTNYSEIAGELTAVIIELEDEITECLANQKLSVEDFDDVEKKINESKHKLYSILFRPLSKNYSRFDFFPNFWKRST